MLTTYITCATLQLLVHFFLCSTHNSPPHQDTSNTSKRALCIFTASSREGVKHPIEGECCENNQLLFRNKPLVSSVIVALGWHLFKYQPPMVLHLCQFDRCCYSTKVTISDRCQPRYQIWRDSSHAGVLAVCAPFCPLMPPNMLHANNVHMHFLL